MKTQINHTIVVAISVLFSMTCQAQEAISGSISNYTGGEKLIAFYDMISKETMEIGTIDEEGNFSIPLDENYLKTIKLKAENAKAKAPEGWEIEFKTVATTFECSGLMVEYENGEALVVGMPDLEVKAKNAEWDESVMYAVSNPEIANWLYSYGEKNSAKGYYLQWFFVEEPASAKAECLWQTSVSTGETYNNKTIINLELQKGWNIIKYNIAEVFTDANGKITPSKTEISRIDRIPDNIQWVVVK
ncbi:hypothetical protein [Psychroflexus sp. MBR-150]|jgi:hypothetical protein